eukprot:RCo042410
MPPKAQKRARDSSGDQNDVELAKKRSAEGSLVVVSTRGSTETVKESGALIPGTQRTSELSSPNIILSGHEGEIFTCKFSPDGNSIASGSFDKRIFLWRVFGNNENYSVLMGHSNAVLELHWSTDSSMIFSCSPDKTVQVWDAESLTRIKRIKHDAMVNTCCPTRKGQILVASGGDDNKTKIWDMRQWRRCAAVLEGSYPITSVAFSEGGDQVFVCDVAGTVEVWELRKNEVLYRMYGHMDAITGSSLSPDGAHLLTNSMDNTLRCWDVRPFVQGGDSQRCVKTFTGHTHGVDKNLLKCSWSADGSMVSSGSSDSPAHSYIWEFHTRKLLYRLPGHKATCNEVVFHPTSPIVLSCSSDSTMWLGELASS